LKLAEAADSGLITPGSGTWVRQLEQNHDNVRAALAWSREGKANRETRLRFAASLWRFWFMRGHMNEGQAWLEQVLAESSAVSKARAKALYGAAFLLWRLGDMQRMAALAEEALACCQQMGDQQGMAYSLVCLGWAAMAQADYQQAAALFEHSLGLFRVVQDLWGISVVLNRLGEVLCDRGEYARAVALFEESLSLFQKMGETLGMSDARSCMGWAAMAQGEYARAVALFEESLRLKRTVGDKHAIAATLFDLGYLAYTHGDCTVARAHYAESLRLYRELGEKRNIAWMSTRSGHLALHEQDNQDATASFKEAIAVYAELEDHFGVMRCLVGLAGVAAARRQPERAARLLGAAEVVSGATNLKMDRIERAEHDRYIAAARSLIDEASFAAAWAAGQALTLEQALAEALDDQEPSYRGGA
jgi:tetratricopeptide (TPR) repeat protein